MNLKKIIKEEIDSFDWTDDATVEDAEMMNLAKEYIKRSFKEYDDIVPEFEKSEGYTHQKWVKDIYDNFNGFWDDEDWVEEEYYDIQWFKQHGVDTREEMTRVLGVALSLF